MASCGRSRMGSEPYLIITCRSLDLGHLWCGAGNHEFSKKRSGKDISNNTAPQPNQKIYRCLFVSGLPGAVATGSSPGTVGPTCPNGSPLCFPLFVQQCVLFYLIFRRKSKPWMKLTDFLSYCGAFLFEGDPLQKAILPAGVDRLVE